MTTIVCVSDLHEHLVDVRPPAHRGRRLVRVQDLVGAQRQSVTTAMGGLTQSGSISRREDGSWVLHGDPPAELRHHRLVAAMS